MNHADAIKFLEGKENEDFVINTKASHDELIVNVKKAQVKQSQIQFDETKIFIRLKCCQPIFLKLHIIIIIKIINPYYFIASRQQMSSQSCTNKTSNYSN